MDEHSKDMFQQVMVARLSRELELNDEETVLLVRRFLDFKEEGKNTRKERNAIVRDLKALVKEGDSKAAEIDAELANCLLPTTKSRHRSADSTTS